MRVSAIVPTWNEAERIAETLALLHRLGVHERIVADGGSTDATAAIAAAAGATVVPAPKGRARQMNAGAAAATGEVLWFVHADASPPPGSLAHIRHALREEDVVAGAFKLWTVPDGGPIHWGPVLHLADLRSRTTRHPYGDQCLFVRADTFRALGGFPALGLMEDLALAQLLWRHGRIARVNARVEVSGRRFEHRPLRSFVCMNTFPTLFRLGVPTTVLARLYGDPR